MLNLNKIITILLIILFLPFIIGVILISLLLSLPFLLFSKKKKNTIFGRNIYTYTWTSGRQKEQTERETPKVEILNPDLQQRTKPEENADEGEYVDYEEVK